MALTANGIGQAQENPRGRPTDQQFDVEKTEDSVSVGKRGEAREKYLLRREGRREQVRLGLTKESKNQGEDAKSIQFNYNEKNGIIAVYLGGSHIVIRIRPNTVSITERCVSTDTACIVQAIKSSLVGLDAEDVAAVQAAIREQMAQMKDGSRILETMEMLANELATGQSQL